MDERLKKQIHFLTEIDKEKQIWRENLLSDMSRHENDAEHSFHTAVMAVVLSEYFNEDNLLKVLEMMLLHDAVEIYAGDTPAYDTEGMKSKEEREKAAADKLYGILPKDQCDKLKKLWIEFEECKTKEAKFCNIIDRMQPTMLIDALGGISWKNRNIRKEQVLNRNKITMSGPDKIREYMEDVITRAYNDGCLK